VLFAVSSLVLACLPSIRGVQDPPNIYRSG
jgi:hypothetical protein